MFFHISPMHVKFLWATSCPAPPYVFIPLLLQATINTSEKIILLLFITTKEFLQSHSPLRLSETGSINPLEFPISFIFMPWLFSLELLHLWIMDKVGTITEGFYTAKRRLDRNYSWCYRDHF